MTTYRTSFYFRPKGDGERTTDLIFEAASHKAAAWGASAWWANRHEAVPERFYRLDGVKIAEYNIKPIDDNGYCATMTDWPFFEWKVATAGCELWEYVNRKFGGEL